MKEYILLFLLTAVSLSISAQWETYPKAGDYIQDPALDKFVGKWQGTKNDTTFTIVFAIERKILAKGDFHYDALVGWHELKIAGKVIESSLVDVGDMSVEKVTCSVGMVHENYEVYFSFYDLTRDKSDGATFIIEAANINRATWSIRNRDVLSKAMSNIGPDGIGRYDGSWTVPTDLVMYRVE